MMLRSALVLLVVLLARSAWGQAVEVPPELWDRPRTGAAVLALEPVRRAVLQALAKSDAQIVIHHGAGQETLVQAEELKSWLAALAVDPRRVSLRADGAASAPMRIEVIQ